MIHSEFDLRRRLPWLLLFQAAVATALLVWSVSADLLHWPVELNLRLLYATVVGSYSAVALLGLLLRRETSPGIVGTAHLISSVAVAFLVVQSTGRVESAFAFLYSLSILDAAIIGGKRVAMLTATACILTYGLQLILELYGIPGGDMSENSPHRFISAFVSHLAASYLIAFLAGYLAELWRGAQRAESTARHSLVRAEEMHRALEREFLAQERWASLGRLSAAIAHELRNPLAAISGCMELLDREANDPSARERLKTIIRREIERLNKLVSDFLIYARPAPPRLLPVDIAALTRETCEIVRADDMARLRTLVVHAPERLEGCVDSGQLQQVLWNLLRNAVEASAEGSTVTVSLFEQGDDRVVLEVHDQGPGIAADIREHLFEPFHTNKAGGTGLGLAVVRRIVEIHGGTVELQSGVGTTARVVLPRRQGVADGLA